MSKNAKISNASLYIEDHDILTFIVMLEWGGCSQGIGGYALDQNVRGESRRRAEGKGLEAMRRIMEVIGVRAWEDLKGKLCRIEETENGKLLLGHILEEKWFDLHRFMSTPAPHKE